MSYRRSSYHYRQSSQSSSPLMGLIWGFILFFAIFYIGLLSQASALVALLIPTGLYAALGILYILAQMKREQQLEAIRQRRVQEAQRQWQQAQQNSSVDYDIA